MCPQGRPSRRPGHRLRARSARRAAHPHSHRPVSGARHALRFGPSLSVACPSPRCDFPLRFGPGETGGPPLAGEFVFSGLGLTSKGGGERWEGVAVARPWSPLSVPRSPTHRVVPPRAGTARPLGHPIHRVTVSRRCLSRGCPVRASNSRPSPRLGHRRCLSWHSEPGEVGVAS